ncbi:MAG: hypothetical protein VXX79_18795 [Pseudomonadota bacterium]|nr:hypothetical protein [Pseudomonadota bacterium]
MGEWSANIGKWADATVDEIGVVFLEAAQALFYDILLPIPEGGRMRIKTGFLRASAKVSINKPITRTERNPLTPEQQQDGRVYFDRDPNEIGLALLGFELGDSIYFTFTANYARPREYGVGGKPGDHFVAAHVANWQQYVDEQIVRVRDR